MKLHTFYLNVFEYLMINGKRKKIHHVYDLAVCLILILKNCLTWIHPSNKFKVEICVDFVYCSPITLINFYSYLFVCFQHEILSRFPKINESRGLFKIRSFGECQSQLCLKKNLKGKWLPQI